MSRKKAGGIKTSDGIAVHCGFTRLATVEELKANPKNPRTHKDSQLRLLSKIIQHDGWRHPVVVSKRSGLIVMGHGRWLSAKTRGWKQVPIDEQDFASEAAEHRAMLADNKIPELAGVDRRRLKDILQELDDGSMDMELTGFTEEELAGMMTEAGKGGGEVPFTEELLESHNYVVLYFDNDFDWQVAVERFGLHHVKDLIPRKGQPTGIGRVLKGKEWLDRIVAKPEGQKT